MNRKLEYQMRWSMPNIQRKSAVKENDARSVDLKMAVARLDRSLWPFLNVIYRI